MSTALQVTWAERPPDDAWAVSRYDETRAKMERALARGAMPRSRWGNIKREYPYVSLDGRSWDEVNAGPKAEDFGGPAHVPYPRLHRDNRYMRSRLKVAQKREDTAAIEAWRIASDARIAAHDVWRETNGYVAYRAACDRHSARAEQFRYTGRARGDKDILAALAPATALTSA